MNAPENPNRNDMKNRPLEPDHPMVLEGGATPGNMRLMVRCQLEEMLMFGVKPDELWSMANDPMYQGLYAAKEVLGETVFREIFEETLARIGVHKATSTERPTEEYPDSFVPLTTLNSQPAKEQHDA